MNAKSKCPITVVTGFLGSGKTTLLSRILAREDMKGTAVLVNEYGKVGLDHSLLKRIDERTILLGGGCVCCNMRDDLVKGLRDLLNSYQRGELAQLDRVVIETTGLADPAPILFTILADPVLVHHFYIDQVVTTVDAVNGELHLQRQPESIKQIAVADKVIVTKTDLAEQQEVEALLSRIKIINPSTSLLSAVFGEVDTETFFSTSQITLDQNSLQNKLSNNKLAPLNHHISNIRSIAITFNEPLDWLAFGIWLSMLLYARGQDVLRVKGLIDVGEAGPVVLNGVQHIIHPHQHLDNWVEEDRTSKLVFIMKDIQPTEILESLEAFQGLIGASPVLLEVNMNV